MTVTICSTNGILQKLRGSGVLGMRANMLTCEVM